MEIVIAAGGMPFGPTTLQHKSLGGSETAIIMMANEFKKRGHLVTVFCDLPKEGQPDFHHNGEDSEEGVRWVHCANYQNYICNTQCDLLIASRDPRLIALGAAAKKKVLYCHDIATHRGMQTAMDQVNWTIDEVWCVSDWYSEQFHKVTGYPRKNIKTIPNGIVPIETIPAPRSETQLVYASRPERGLVNLIKEGGVMEHLPEFELKVAMYDHFPEDMKEFYTWIFERIKQCPNVEVIGALPQQQMRQLLADSAAYIYPTQFEETSCILARECIEQRTPFLTTPVGALPETLGDCGLFFEAWDTDHKPGSPEWCKDFADWFRLTLEDDILIPDVQRAMAERTDLYWDTGAEAALRHARPAKSKLFSQAWSLVQDGDVIPAYALLTAQDELDTPSFQLATQIEEFYPFLLPEEDINYETLASYYKRFYAFKKPEINYGIDYARNTNRFETIKKTIAQTTKPGDTIVEYGCGEGHISGPLAKDFPDREFIAFDQVQQNVDMVNKFHEDFDILNLEAYVAETPEDAYRSLVLNNGVEAADAVICVEVLEHCVEPWDVARGVEALVKPGGQVIITTPVGAWEPMTFEVKPEEWAWRNHIWHLDKPAARKMFGKKPAMQMISLANGTDMGGRPIGNLFYTFEADHKPIKKLNALAKARDAHARQTCAAAVICMNDEDTVLNMLHSIDRQVQHVQFAMGPSTDRTRELIVQFFSDHPHMSYNIIDVPKIEAAIEKDGEWSEGFSFGDARNISTFGLYPQYDWVLWIDTDEYLSGDIARYLRPNALDGYLIPQHHFTVAPRGAPIQIDRPARLFRTTAGFTSVGKIHEHFEKPKGGPGMCFMLTDVDLGHTGYVNEGVRKDRFARNWPFLVWDHATNPERRLGKYLWFRDIIHRMRWATAEGANEAAVGLANEAEKYYNDNWKLMATFGMGTFQAIQYLAEARKVLQKGTPMKVSIVMDDRNCELEGLWLSTDELTRVLKQILDPEFKRRGSKYY